MANRTRELANLSEAEQVGYDGLAAQIFIGTVGMQPIATAPRFQIDQWRGKIVAAQKPGKCPPGLRLPLEVPVRAPGRETRRDRSRGLEWLLIETGFFFTLAIEAL